MPLPQQTRDPVLAATFPLPPQDGLNARAPLGASAGLKHRLNLGHEPLLLLGPGAFGFVLVRIITAGTDCQRLGQRLDLLFSFQSVPELEARFRFPSETMAKAFLKCPAASA